MKRNLADRNVVKPTDAKTLELKDEHWQLMSDLLPVLQPLVIEGRGNRRPDPAPFPANDGTPSLPADDRHSGRWRDQNCRGRVRGERDRGTVMAISPRTTGRGITAPPSPLGCHWTIGRRRRRIGRVKRRAAAGSPVL